MSGLILPPAELARQREEFKAQLLEQAIRHTAGILEEFNYLLRRVNPKLEMVRAGEQAEPPWRPGFYHVICHNPPPAHPNIMVVEGERGEFVEPTSRVFDRLREGDLHNPEVYQRVKDFDRKAAAEADRLRAREKAEREEEVRERVLAATRTQVSMNPDVPWAQNSAGRRGRTLRR